VSWCALLHSPLISLCTLKCLIFFQMFRTGIRRSAPSCRYGPVHRAMRTSSSFSTLSTEVSGGETKKCVSI
jgi:hypothetical protein